MDLDRGDRQPDYRRDVPDRASGPPATWCATCNRAEPERYDHVIATHGVLQPGPRIGTLSMAGADGTVDVTVYGSPRMTDERTVVLGSGTNRTLANLRQNPRAVYMIIEPGESIMDWKGVRAYMTLKDLATQGPAFDEYMAQIARVAGEAAASMIHALATFEITEVRPILNMGQGWERSI